MHTAVYIYMYVYGCTNTCDVLLEYSNTMHSSTELSMHIYMHMHLYSCQRKSWSKMKNLSLTSLGLGQQKCSCGRLSDTA